MLKLEWKPQYKPFCFGFFSPTRSSFINSALQYMIYCACNMSSAGCTNIHSLSSSQCGAAETGEARGSKGRWS